MWMETDIYALYGKREDFHSNYFAHLDEYDSLRKEYLWLYAALEGTLDDKNFAILEKLIRCQEKIEEFYAMHYFRQGALLGKTGGKIQKSY